MKFMLGGIIPYSKSNKSTWIGKEIFMDGGTSDK